MPGSRPFPRPTRRHRADIRAWTAYQCRHASTVELIARTLLVVVMGALAALALVHWATPCADATLCAVLALPGRLPRCYRRLQARLLRVRQQQLLGTAQAMATDPTPGAALRLGAVLAKAAVIGLQLDELERSLQA